MTLTSSQICKYLGIPWGACGRSLDGLDCWGLVWYIYKHELGIEIDEYPSLNTENPLKVKTQIQQHIKNWDELKIPVEGCVVGMGTNKFISHVGIYFELGVLHSYKQAEFSVYTPFLNLTTFNILGFYKWSK